MKITVVHYSALVNTGNYENEKVGLDAQLEDGENVAQVVEALKDQAFALLDRKDLLQARREAVWELRELEDKLAEARTQWEKAKEFLRAQGLRPDAPDFPIPGLKQLTTSERIHTEVADTENDDLPEDEK